MTIDTEEGLATACARLLGADPPIIRWLERHPRVTRALDRPAIVRPLAAVLNALNDRRRLDMQLRTVGAPGARWWETRERLEERLVSAVWGDAIGRAVARDGFHVQVHNDPEDAAARRIRATIRTRLPRA